MFSQTVEYALRAVMFVAGSGGMPVNSERISKQMHVPRFYMSKVMRGLVVANIIESKYGPNGGFILAKPMDQISVLDILNAVDPLSRITSCPLGRPDHVKLCPLHREMDDAMHHIECRLRNVSIEQLQEKDLATGSLAIINAPRLDHPIGPARRGRQSRSGSSHVSP